MEYKLFKVLNKKIISISWKASKPQCWKMVKHYCMVYISCLRNAISYCHKVDNRLSWPRFTYLGFFKLASHTPLRRGFKYSHREATVKERKTNKWPQSYRSWKNIFLLFVIYPNELVISKLYPVIFFKVLLKVSIYYYYVIVYLYLGENPWYFRS